MLRFWLFFWLLLPLAGLAQSAGRCSGVVYDPQGMPLAGAAVQIQGGAGQSTVTDGRFALRLSGEGPWTLEVRFLGYEIWRETFSVGQTEGLVIRLQPAAYDLQALELLGTWVPEDAPFATQTVSREQLEARNQGQDIPWLLRNTPGLVASSDAGTGIGYTGLRIRGSDPTRINVTINGVPLNDSESQAVFWVNMPDIAASLDQIQIQRGVGTSTNGAGAFGASINLQTQTLREEPYGEWQVGGGSFQTRRMRAAFGTGTLPGGWSFDGRWSLIRSEGYIDRASANLQSLYGSMTWKGRATLFRLLAFQGRERTYQAWWGTPQSRIENDTVGMLAHAARNGFSDAQTQNLLESGRTYNYYQYENEVDQYAQTNVQAHLAHAIDARWRANVTLHYTRGAGYFEQFRPRERLTRYGLTPITIGGETISRFDVVRRRWLDNHFAGAVANLRYETETFDWHIGGSWNRYLGDHFGQITWASLALDIPPDYQYYFGDARKTDGNLFTQATWRFAPGWQAFGDLQYREVRYRTAGTENNLRSYDVDVVFPFFNPKAGLSWAPSTSWSFYASTAVGQREPLRRDFVDAPEGQVPRAERMLNTEAGTRWRRGRWQAELNAYLMDYRDQLVPTGALNDVGASLLTNVDRSRRWGLEATGSVALNPQLDCRASIAWSRSRIEAFDEIIYDYTDGFEVLIIPHRGTEIAYSPQWVLFQETSWRPGRGWVLTWMLRHVGEQYLDNTRNRDRAMDPWWVHDVLVGWEYQRPGLGKLRIQGQLNNALNVRYSNNGYTYSYIAGESVTENFFYPQAGRHALLGLTLQF